MTEMDRFGLLMIERRWAEDLHKIQYWYDRFASAILRRDLRDAGRCSERIDHFRKLLTYHKQLFEATKANVEGLLG